MLKLISAHDMKFSNVEKYVNSFTDKWRDLNCYALSLVPEGVERYTNYICSDRDIMYFLVDDSDENTIIGYGSIEDSEILDYHKSYLNEGNIGYGIRPDLRGKHYGTELLKLLLKECEKRGMSEVCVSCHQENLASNGVIRNNNGKLEKEFFDDWSGKKANKYWIKLNPKLKDLEIEILKVEKENLIKTVKQIILEQIDNYFSKKIETSDSYSKKNSEGIKKLIKKNKI